MISKNENMDNFIQNYDAMAKAVDAQQSPDWLNAWRQKGMSRFEQLGIPTVKNEEWKYTGLSELTAQRFQLVNDGKLIETEQFEAYRGANDINLVFVNGIFANELSSLGNLPKGIDVSTLQEAIKAGAPKIQELLTTYDIDKETAFVALNEAAYADGAFVRVDADVAHRGLIHLIHVTSANNKKTVTMPRTLIALGQSSEMTVLESHISFNDSITYFTNALTDIFIEDNATLHYCKAQKESLNAFHVGRTRVWQGAHSNLDGFTLTVGSKLTRNDLDITLNGEGSNATLNALYSLYNEQHVDNHTSVDHRVPNCTSNQLYKGILNGASRAVFNGKIFVRPIAQQTNSYQLNKNLLLGKDCRVDTKPQLEIYADDVKCTHGATIGQLDEDEMFYLQTRCIPRKMATQMLVHGFVNDLFQTIKDDCIRAKVNALMQPSFEVLS